MPPHEPALDDYEPITKLILNLDLNAEGMEQKTQAYLRIRYMELIQTAIQFPSRNLLGI